MTWACTWVKTHAPPLMTWLQHTQLLRHLTCRVEGLGHKLFMGNFFPSPRLCDDLERRKINSCGTVRPNRKDMPPDFAPKNLKLKRGNVKVRTRGNLTALVWKDRRDVYMLTNMDPPPAEGNFCDGNNRPVKPRIVARYNRHMGYIDNSDRMANSYSMSKIQHTLLLCLCSVRKGTTYKCVKCNVGLCVVPCFADYHTKVNL
jgi:hypothetical protein